MPGEPKMPPPERQRWVIPGALAVLALATLAVYANSFSAPFVFDDVPSTLQNPTIRQLWPLVRVFSPPHGRGLTVEDRPILNLSLAINHAVSGDAVWSYHVLNLLIHLCAGFCLFGIVRRTLASGPRCGLPPNRANPAAAGLGFAVALLWTLHPLQTESVTYVIQRAESLMGLFYFLTLYCFIRFSDGDRSILGAGKPLAGFDTGGAVWASLSVLFCLLGMATKEVMVSAPLMVLLYDRTFVAGSFGEAWRRHRRFYVGLAATWGLLIALVISGGGNRSGSAGFGVGVAWAEYGLTQFRAIAHYLWLAIWPHPLVFDYPPFWVATPADAAAFALIVVPLIAATALALWRWPAWGFLGAWFFAVLAPTSLVPGTTQMIVEHRMYLALAPVMTAAVVGAYGLRERLRSSTFRGDDPGGRAAPWLVLTLGLVAATYGSLTARRNADYASALILWTDTAAKCPDNPYAHYNLAIELAKLPGQTAEALAHYRTAVQINPNFADAHYNLALELAKAPGRDSEAVAQFEEVLRIKPNFAPAHENLGLELAKSPGRLLEAVAHHEAALRIKPDDAEAHNNLAMALAVIPGRIPEALRHYERALQIDPKLAEAHYNYANTLAAIPGRLSAALAHYERALQINPNFAEAHDNFANALATIPGRGSEAIEHYRAALRLKPNFAEAHYNLATELAKNPTQTAEALNHYEEALRINPGGAAAHNSIAVLDAKLGHFDDAIAHLRMALTLDPSYGVARANLEKLEANH